MSNTEETPESSRKKSSFVDEFLESGRKKARTSLSSDDKHIEDLEYMLKSVKALIKIINEIWNNCREHLTSSENNESPFIFRRTVCKEAKVEKKGRNSTITTKVESNTKDFGSPPDVPEDLSNIICFGPPESENEVLPDYNRYLEKSSVLCEDVLLPFLTGFKKYLENVQVFVGLIDAWLLEPEVIDSFLDQTFDGPGCLRQNDPSKTILYCSYCLDVNSKLESTHNLCTEKGREGLKTAFALVKIFEPVPQIEVKDAGEKAVNGTYTIGGTHNGVYFYSRSGVWDGKHTNFYLFRIKNKKTWWLTCRHENTMAIKVRFYETEAKGEEYELPPLNGWRIGGDEDDFKGIDPPPKILYKVDVV